MKNEDKVPPLSLLSSKDIPVGLLMTDTLLWSIFQIGLDELHGPRLRCRVRFILRCDVTIDNALVVKAKVLCNLLT